MDDGTNWLSGKVHVWGRRPPPLGGVTTSVAKSTEGIARAGYHVRSVDVSRRQVSKVLEAAWDGRGVSLVHASGPSSVMKMLPFITPVAHPKALFIHAAEGASPSSLRFPRGFVRFGLPRFAMVWATNADLAAVLEEAAGREVRVASPHVSLAAPIVGRDLSAGDADLRIVAFAYNSQPLYNAELSLNVVKELRGQGRPARLTVVTYGGETRSGQWSLLKQADKELEWFSLVENVDGTPADVHLRSADVLMRLTTTDGDALIVREALDAGLRVVASDVVPRPAGVELVSLDDERAVVEALQGSGRLSDGAGLGRPIVEEFDAWVRALA